MPERWRQIEDLFHAARERPPEDRDAFLTAECAGDLALRQEVESLLGQPDGMLLRDGIEAAAAALVTPAAHLNHEGRALGAYVLGPLLGSGGMGDVYRARDAKLGRDVAVKILPDTLGQHPERLARFDREARILAALNHPNIAAIYGLEESDGLRGLVLELIDGVTLAETLRRKCLPADEALAIARQIAHALEAAHQKGIIHRDLKPANILITLRGVVKVLDFGLAKIEASDATGPASVPALETRDGVVLGTVAYMSPEQARGLAVDKRTDIWAFGCVLYEMLTGSRPFPGESSADVLGAITSAQPNWTLLPRDTPRRVHDLLRRCLTKDPELRLHDIADARIEIDDAISGDRGDHRLPLRDESALRYDGTRRDHPRTLVPWILSGIMAIAAAVAIWLAIFATTSETRNPARVSIALPPDVSLYAIGRGSSVAVSPDGQRIVYVAVSGGRTQLHMRLLDGLDSIPIAGTEGGANPFFSPDGRWIGFMDGPNGGSLKKVPVQGGAVLTVIDSKGDGLRSFAARGAAWAPDDTIVFEAINPASRGLWRVAAGGGSPERLTTPRDGELFHSWPQLVPGGKAVLYTIWNNTSFDGGRIAVQSLDGGEPTILVHGASYGRVISSGGQTAYLVYAQPEGLLAARFDVDRLRLIGRSMPVVHGVLTNLSGGAHFGVSSTGLLAYIPGKLDEVDKTLLWVGQNGATSDIAKISGIGFQYRLSPDGRRIVRPNAIGPNRDLWVDDLEGRALPTRLTAGGVHNVPIWTHDGRRVIYSAGVPNGNLFWRAADGTGDAERLTTSANLQIAGSVSPDGSTLAYAEIDATRGADIWLLPLQQPRQARLVLGTPFGEYNPRISPNGRWVAYQSDISGQFEIYLTAFVSGGRQIPVSKGGGFAPLWAPDGRELYYRSVEPAQGGEMMVVSIDATGAEPKISTPRVLFESPYQGEGDIAPDGRFLLLKRPPQEASARAIQLVLNWLDDLQQKVPLQ